jgi:hypothetical protein
MTPENALNVLIETFPSELSLSYFSGKLQSHSKYSAKYVGRRGAIYIVTANPHQDGVIEDRSAPVFSVINQRSRALGQFCISHGIAVECGRHI